MLDLLPAEEAVEPESSPKELDVKELSMEDKDVAELLKEPLEDVNHDVPEEESDESQAVSVVVALDVGVVLFWALATANKRNAKAVFCIMAE
jgi:hypothetical protein